MSCQKRRKYYMPVMNEIRTFGLRRRTTHFARTKGLTIAQCVNIKKKSQCIFSISNGFVKCTFLLAVRELYPLTKSHHWRLQLEHIPNSEIFAEIGSFSKQLFLYFFLFLFFFFFTQKIIFVDRACISDRFWWNRFKLQTGLQSHTFRVINNPLCGPEQFSFFFLTKRNKFSEGADTQNVEPCADLVKRRGWTCNQRFPQLDFLPVINAAFFSAPS